MRSFRDNEKREWTITVNVMTAKAVRDLAGVNLFDLVDPGKPDGQKFFDDQIAVFAVLFVLCKKQCEDRKMTEDDFAAAMIGDAMLDGCKALVNGVVDFFPEQKKTLYRKLIDKSQQMSELMLAKAHTELDALDVTKVKTHQTSSQSVTESVG